MKRTVTIVYYIYVFIIIMLCQLRRKVTIVKAARTGGSEVLLFKFGELTWIPNSYLSLGLCSIGMRFTTACNNITSPL